MNRKIFMAATLGGAIALSGCAGMTDTQQRMTTGGAMGAAGGAVIGAITGDWAWAAAGAAVGVAGGYLVEQQKRREQQAYEAGVRSGQTQTK